MSNNIKLTFEDACLEALKTQNKQNPTNTKTMSTAKTTKTAAKKPAATKPAAKKPAAKKPAAVPRDGAQLGRIVFSSIFASNALALINSTDATVDLRWNPRSTTPGLSGDDLETSLGDRYNAIPTGVVNESDPAREIKEAARRLVVALRRGYDIVVVENAVRNDRSLAVLVAAEIVAIDPSLGSRLWRNVGYTTRDGVIKEYQFRDFVTEADASASMAYHLAKARNPLGWSRRIPDCDIRSI